MASTKSTLIAIGVGVLAYVGALNIAGRLQPESDAVARIGDTMVTPSATKVSRLVPRGATMVPQSVTPSATMVPQSVTPSATMVPPVTPRISVAVSPTTTPSVMTPTPTPLRTPTPLVTPRIEATPTPSSIPSAVPTPMPTLIAIPSSTATPATSAVSIVINEIAWAGTVANASDEWIELYNSTDAAIDVSGWALFESDTKIITLQGSIGAHAYFLIERTDDTAVSDIVADLVGPFGGSGLSNAGEKLSLRDGSGGVVDLVDCSGGWFNAADGAQKLTMERILSSSNGSDASNWGSNSGAVTTGEDAKSQPLRGTPKYKNSIAK